MSGYKKKLIEVALPLEAINRESAREKSIRHGHPSTLHLWWARRPLAACRAVLFSQLVDDPSAHPEKFPTEEDQAVERQRLFNIIERLVVWENINDEALLKEAHEEILKSTDGNPPPILDPFAGGGSIPLEAQRLGLKAYASDLNPVAVLINKALIEIPPKWAGQPPVFPGAAEAKMMWPKATGLAEDVRRYGQWMRDEAEKRVGHLYPKATLPDGTQTNVIAWIWARTMTCPNPGCGVRMPLVRSWWLGKKKGREAFVLPSVEHSAEGVSEIKYTVHHDLAFAPAKEGSGTISRSGAFCFACGSVVPRKAIQEAGMVNDMKAELLAVVADGDRRRMYLSPDATHAASGNIPPPKDFPDLELAIDPRNVWTPLYGLGHLHQLFTPRQLTTLTVFSDLVPKAFELVLADAAAAGRPAPEDYATAVATYLGLAVGRLANRNASLVIWNTVGEKVEQVFMRQALSMTWEFAEANPFSESSGNFLGQLGFTVKALEFAPAIGQATAEQVDARSRSFAGALVSTDPPYYDNIAYANLADFFYGWLRRSLAPCYPNLFGTLQTPKTEELVADLYRHGGKKEASDFFEQGFNAVFANIRRDTPDGFPITVFYAFKQSETQAMETSSTGWQTLLDGMLQAGWAVTATWPVRTERSGGVRDYNSNMLASSIVLALRPRSESAETISRRGFVQALKLELPRALRDLQQGSIAPVDLAQAAIGPGMAVFSRHSRVLEADGSEMSVRTALALINQALDEVLEEQEGDFDVETRFAVKWFSQNGWNEAASGEADVLTRAVNTTVTMLERGGIFRAAAGKARLLQPTEMSKEWNPADDKAISVWEVAVRLGHALITEGADQASVWMHEAASRVDLDAVKELSYLMYSVCERKGWTESAMLFNALGTSWNEVSGAARTAQASVSKQSSLDFGDDDE